MRGKKDLFMLIVGLVLFIFDVVTDIIVAVQYKRQGDILQFFMTVLVIVLSFIMVSVFVAFRLFDTFSKGLSMFLMSIFLRYVKEFVFWKRKYRDNSPCGDNYKECNCAKCRKHCEVIAEGNKSAYDFAWMRLAEAALESAPQWCLQVYIMLRQWDFPWYTIISVVLSFLSLTWSFTNLEKARVNYKGHDFKLQAAVVFFTFQLFSLLARLLSLAVLSYGLVWSFGFVLCCNIVIFSIVVAAILFRYELRDEAKYLNFINMFFTFPVLYHVSESTLPPAPMIYFVIYSLQSVQHIGCVILAITYPNPIRGREATHMSEVGPIALSLVIIDVIAGTIFLIVYIVKYQEKPPIEPAV
jgi:hypothetical protein